MSTRRRWLAALAVVALAAAGCNRGGPRFNNTDVTGAEFGRDFELVDHTGKTRTLADFRGKVVTVFFGYTQCPDVCPTTLAEMAAARKLMGADGAKVQPVFVTVDPDRDSAAVLKSYVASFGDDVVALRGNADEIKAVAKHFKVFYNKVPGKTEGSYTVDHTAGSYVFDTQGRVRLFTRYGVGPETLAADLKQLLAAG